MFWTARATAIPPIPSVPIKVVTSIPRFWRIRSRKTDQTTSRAMKPRAPIAVAAPGSSSTCRER